MKSLAESTTNYFKYWGEKNITALADLLSEDVRLKDREIEVSGIESVLEANSNIFASVKNLGVSVEDLSYGENTVFCKITVHANDTDIPVVDILEFNEAGKIKNITAYRGN